MRRVGVIFLLLVSLIFGLCGCGSSVQKTGDTDNTREIRYHDDGRIILTYSVYSVSSEITKAVNEFNKVNQEYYVEIQNFGEGKNNDISAAILDFDLALVNSQAGDILQVDESSYEKYARMGVFEDLYPYMEADDEFDISKYWENVIAACEIDDKLFYMPANFNVNVMFGKASVWEGKNTLTVDETIELLEGLQEGEELVYHMTRKDFLSDMMNNASNHFVNWTTGECNFQSEQFMNVLKVAKFIPAEFVYNENEEHYISKLRNNKILLYEKSGWDYRDIQYIKAYMGEDIVAVNYPGATSEGNTISLFSQHTYAMNSDSVVKEGVWEFIKFVLSEDYQKKKKEGIWGVPMNKAAFEKQMQEWKTPAYELDENGKKVERPILLFISEDIQFEIYHATDEDVALWRQSIENVTSVKTNNYVLTNIILEEAEPYFDGEKTVEEVTGIIQNRVNIYVNENK